MTELATTEPPPLLIDVGDLRRQLDGRTLPGDSLVIEGFESALADYALLAPDDNSNHAHPMWLLILSLRGMGISVDELCALAAQRPQDTLLFGNCEISQDRPLEVGHRFRTTAEVGAVKRKESRGGGILDFVTVGVEIFDEDDPSDHRVGSVSNGFIFKRGA